MNEYWIDLEQNAAIARTVHIGSRGNVAKEVDLEYQETPHGWLLSKWTINGGEGMLDTLEVTAYEIDPDFSSVEFYVDPKPGTIYRNEGEREAMVAGNPGEPDMTYAHYEILQERNHQNRNWILSLLCVVVVTVGVFWWRKRQTRN